jgi:hypothetical protein
MALVGYSDSEGSDAEPECSGLISGIATRILAGLLGSIWNPVLEPNFFALLTQIPRKQQQHNPPTMALVGYSDSEGSDAEPDTTPAWVSRHQLIT